VNFQFKSNLSVSKIEKYCLLQLLNKVAFHSLHPVHQITTHQLPVPSFPFPLKSISFQSGVLLSISQYQTRLESKSFRLIFFFAVQFVELLVTKLVHPSITKQTFGLKIQEAVFTLHETVIKLGKLGSNV
jgi:hypothetical protein